MVEIPSTDWRTWPWEFDEALPWAPVAAQWSLLPGTVRHGFTHFRLELGVAAANAAVPIDGIWCAVDRLGEHALPTLMKKIAGHATAALGAGQPSVRLF
jgi:A/G-specific adenine glycosylase